MSKHKPAAKPKSKRLDMRGPRKIITKCGGTGRHDGYRRGWVITKAMLFGCRVCGDSPK